MMYEIVYRDILSHHGILGMKWGKRNGPPYPLDAEDHSASERKAGWRNSLSSASKSVGKRISENIKEDYRHGYERGRSGHAVGEVIGNEFRNIGANLAIGVGGMLISSLAGPAAPIVAAGFRGAQYATTFEYLVRDIGAVSGAIDAGRREADKMLKEKH